MITVNAVSKSWHAFCMGKAMTGRSWPFPRHLRRLTAIRISAGFSVYPSNITIFIYIFILSFYPACNTALILHQCPCPRYPSALGLASKAAAVISLPSPAAHVRISMTDPLVENVATLSPRAMSLAPTFPIFSTHWRCSCLMSSSSSRKAVLSPLLSRGHFQDSPVSFLKIRQIAVPALIKRLVIMAVAVDSNGMSFCHDSPCHIRG